MATADHYRFALDGWCPHGGGVISSSWWHTKHLGLDYVMFSAVVDVRGQVVIVEVRCDPCDSAAKEAYREMVHLDLDLAVRKALTGGEM